MIKDDSVILRDLLGGAVPARADVVFITAPYDLSSYLPGSRFGPDRILDGRLDGCGQILLDAPLEHLESLSSFSMQYAMLHAPVLMTEEALTAHISRGLSCAKDLSGLPLLLGGEHTLSYHATKVLTGALELGNFAFLVFDAHADMAPCGTEDPPFHGAWLRRAIQDGIVAGAHILLVGTRDILLSEANELRTSRAKVLSSLAWRRDSSVCLSTILEFCRGRNLYVSVDLDALDPAVFPAVSCPAPSGLSVLDLILAIASAVSVAERIIGIDLVEFNPSRDVHDLSQVTACRIISDLLCILAARKAGLLQGLLCPPAGRCPP